MDCGRMGRTGQWTARQILYPDCVGKVAVGKGKAQLAAGARRDEPGSQRGVIAKCPGLSAYFTETVKSKSYMQRGKATSKS